MEDDRIHSNSEQMAQCISSCYCGVFYKLWDAIEKNRCVKAIENMIMTPIWLFLGHSIALECSELCVEFAD